MKSNDIGLQNAMKIQLSVEMAKARAAKSDGDVSANKHDSRKSV